jgi:hypothetical protein
MAILGSAGSQRPFGMRYSRSLAPPLKAVSLATYTPAEACTV